jgi:hypothetical protein
VIKKLLFPLLFIFISVDASQLGAPICNTDDKEKTMLHSKLLELRDQYAVQMIDSHIVNFMSSIRVTKFLNTTAQICIASGIIVSTAAGYFKIPILAFAASGCGVLGMAIRGVADYVKKEGRNSLNTASFLLEKEGVQGFEPYFDHADKKDK